MIYTRPQVAATIPHPLAGLREHAPLPPLPRFTPRPGQILAMYPRPRTPRPGQILAMYPGPQKPRAEIPRTATPEHISVILERMPLIQELKLKTQETPQETPQEEPNDRNTRAISCRTATGPQ